MGSRNDSVFVRDAATKIFSTAGLVGRSVTGRPSNRTKGDPKPPLDSVKLSALKGNLSCIYHIQVKYWVKTTGRQVHFCASSDGGL